MLAAATLLDGKRLPRLARRRNRAVEAGDLGMLTLRLVAGGLLAGHGAQKLFGWFGGHGQQGTAGWLESLGFRPGRHWALAAGVSEFGGGLLTGLGLLNPLGPITMMAPMTMATVKVHWGKPIWVTAGGAELPVTNMAIAAAVAAGGPGRYSLDRLLRIRLPWQLTVLAAAGTAVVVGLGLMSRPPAPPPDAAATELQAQGPE